MPIHLGDDSTHFKKNLGIVGVSDGSKLEILLAHGVSGYHRILGTIYVAGMCGGHSAGRTGLVRHFLISALAGYDETTADVIDYEDAFSYNASGITFSALDNADNIADCSSENTDDFAMTIANDTGHGDNIVFQVWVELFGNVGQMTPSIGSVPP